MVRDDQIDAELARPLRGLGAANAAVHRNDQLHALRVKAIDRGGLQAIAVAVPVGDEVHDVAAEHLERPAQDNGRGDAVDVVVAVNRDALPLRQRQFQPVTARSMSASWNGSWR